MRLLGKVLAVVALLSVGAAEAQIGGGSGSGSGSSTFPFTASGNGATTATSSAVRAGRSIGLTDDFGAIADTIVTQMNVTTTTGGSSTAINFAKSGSFASPAFNAMDVGKTISVAGAGTGGATLITTITAVNSATQIVIATGASTALTGSSQYVSYGTDNTSKIQAAIAQAQTSGLPLRVPSSSAGCFGYAGALTITANVTVVGDALVKSWAGGINAPLATPALTGSVICPTSSGANAITASGITPQINLRNLGVMFQTPFVNTGDGFNLVQALQGLTDPFWENVAFYGHDGNHYAVNLQNPLLGVYNDVESYGGGVLKEYAVNGIGNFGNQVWEHLYGQIVTGGSANGVNLDAATQSNLALLTFIRPQMITDNISSLSGSNPPTSSQQIWNETVNVTNVRKIAPDFESNVGSSFTLAYIFRGDDPDWNSLFTTAPSINMPAWGVNGALFGPQTRVLNDTTSSGAATNTGIFTLTGNTITATSPTTYPVLTTLYIGPPICGTNCTATRLDALYTTGEIFTTSDIGANGFFGTGTTLITGTITLNKNATANTTEICDGTTTGACTIGGASNIVKLGSNVQVTGSAPTNTGSCAINTQLGGPMAGSFKSNGACVGGTIIFTFAAAPNGWSCDAHDLTTTADAINPTAYTTTTVQFTGTMAASDLVTFKCVGF